MQYKNPSNNSFNIKLPNEFKNAIYTLFDMFGCQLIFDETIKLSLNLDLSDFTNGVYFLNVEDGMIRATVRLIKK
ncbi:T9SS type A sorting domain-containing protein [Aquimarina rubra]|uniref:T9SS type A sorting domain-containing protein n=1 Tax=Aquimarina rubra TaxID=1920033 RepID=A0ABW5LFQ4_9FLAO